MLQLCVEIRKGRMYLYYLVKNELKGVTSRVKFTISKELLKM